MFVHHGETTTYFCQQMQKGMHAGITVNDCATRLSLCEVEVHGYSFNFHENAGKG